MKHAPAFILIGLAIVLLGFTRLARPNEICGVVVTTDREVSVWHAEECPEWEATQTGAEIDTAAVTFWRGRIPPVCQGVAILRREGDPVPRAVPLLCSQARTDGRTGPRG